MIDTGLISESNPNTNCLEGKRCPSCGSFGPFEMFVSMRVILGDDGVQMADDPAVEYFDETSASCSECGYRSSFGAFDQ
jgi:hypothetical protein